MRTVALLLLTFFLVGCGAGGALTQKVFGPPAIPAQYILRNRPTLILVENFRKQSELQLESESLERELREQFVKHKIEIPLVSADALYELRDIDSKAYHKLTIPEVGKKCGAEQVIYIDVMEMNVTSHASDAAIEGSSATLVRVVDVPTGSTLFPTDAQGVSVGLKVPARSFSEDVNATTVRQKILHLTADRIARIFYSYKPDEIEK